VLVLGGDCTQIIAPAHRRRAATTKHVNLLWFDYRGRRPETLPASTPSGRLDGMGLASIIGKGSPELVRFLGRAAAGARTRRAHLRVSSALNQPEVDFSHPLAAAPMFTAADITLHGAEKIGARRPSRTSTQTPAKFNGACGSRCDCSGRVFRPLMWPDSGGLSFAEVRSFVCGICEAGRICWGSMSLSTIQTGDPRWFGRKKK